MSLSLLLEKYDVSTEEGLQKALGDIEKEESEVDEALSGILSRACTLEGRLRAASQAYTKLGEMKSDAQSAADMVDKTAGLARDVSAKVRQLDLARSRVAECQRRVHDLIDLQLCSAGVEAAIKAHDYETGAAHVSRFLSMDPGSVAAAQARGAGDPRDAMMKAANTLREHIVRKFEEAARKEDEASIERLFKLFPQIGRAEEGVDLLAKYLAGQAEGNIRRACVVSEVNSEAAVFADAITRVVEAGGAAVDRARNTAKMSPGLLPRAIAVIQPQVCAGVRRVYVELVSARRLAGGAPPPACARAAEPVLAELALAHSRLRLYFNFLKRKTEADACTLDEAKQKACADAVEKIINECDLMRTAQDILGHYLELERYFLEESVNKALKMATPQVGVSTSSLVDDVFFIARKVIRRSLCSGSVDGACAVLNETGAVLERDVCGALRRRLRAPPPDALPLAPPPPPPPPPGAAPRLTPQAPPAVAQRLNRETEAQRLLYLAHVQEAEAGEEWATRLASEACASAEPLYRSDTERQKLQSCAAGLAAAAAGFRAARDVARAALRADLHHRLAAWADFLAKPADNPDELEEDADALPQALEQWMEGSKQLVSASTVEALLHSALQDIATRAHRLMLHYHYTRESGLHVERRARRLSAWAGGAVGGAGRERCARLAGAAALLALEHAEHAPAALAPPARLSHQDESGLHVERRARRLSAWAGGAVGGAGRERCARLAGAAALLALEHAEHAPAALAPPARLSHQDVRDLLARRVDFKIEDIKRLKL